MMLSLCEWVSAFVYVGVCVLVVGSCECVRRCRYFCICMRIRANDVLSIFALLRVLVFASVSTCLVVLLVAPCFYACV